MLFRLRFQRGGGMLLEGKKGVIFGVANQQSIAWGIARSCHREGARLALNFQNDRLKERVESLAQELRDPLVAPCDLTKLDEVDAFFKIVEEKFGTVDFLVHAVAYAPAEALKGRFADVTPADFATTLDISCYTLITAAKRAEPLMKNGGGIVTLTYLAADRVLPKYNVMGVAKAALESTVRYLAAEMGPANIRVNAISAGPIKTLAARGVGDLNPFMHHHAEKSPLRRNNTQEEVGDASLLFLSDLGRGITGETLFVDSGYHAIIPA